MNGTKKIPWKLKFKCSVGPRGRATCVVQSVYPFKGDTLFIDNDADKLVIDKIAVGKREQLASEVPAVVLHGQKIEMQVGMPEIVHQIGVRNETDQTIEFRAELYGTALVPENITALSDSEWEGPTEPDA
jgi:hypothetical protein